MVVPQPFNNLWHEIEEAIHQATQNEESLDNYIQLIVYASDFSEDGDLPAGFVESVSAVIGEVELNTITHGNMGK